MKRVLSLLTLFVLLALTAAAQPQKSRVNSTRNRNTQQQRQQQAVSRASLMFPTAVDVPQEVSWRRDIYRTLDLTKDENAPLYYPTTPRGNEQNLFTVLFRLLNTGKIPAYEYDINDGRENFEAANRMHFKDMLDRYSIFYEIDGNSIKVADADIPSSEVLSFNVKESSYYDQNTATYHSRVVAICPVLHRADEFSFDGGDARKYPLFWVKIDDVEPYLSQHMVMVSNINNASRMSMADYFATNKYKGTIYMTTNMQNRSLQQQFPSDSLLRKEQSRIEKEMADFEEHIWKERVDSVELARKDSIAAAEAAKKPRGIRSSRTPAKEGDAAKAPRSQRRTSVATKKEKTPSASSGGGSAAPRVSVRRQRH